MSSVPITADSAPATFPKNREINAPQGGDFAVQAGGVWGEAFPPRKKIKRPSIATRNRTRALLVLCTGSKCHYCETQLLFDSKSDRFMTIDHLWPVSSGRVDRLWNFSLACRSCNGKRGAEMTWCKCPRCRFARAFAPLYLRLIGNNR